MACGAALAAAAPIRADDRPGALATVPVAGGADALASAAGLPPPASRATLLLDVIRRVHAAAEGDAGALARREAVLAALAQTGAGATDTLPLPFDAALWSQMVLRRPVPPEGLPAAILADPRAAWLYYGAVGLDDETRAWVASRPHRLIKLGLRAGAFAAFSPSLRVQGTRVMSPGGPAADGIWKALVGKPPTQAEYFIDRLLKERDGRLAWLYDTISRLDAGQQRHLLEGEGALERVRRLADLFTRVDPQWRIEDRPLWRPLVDPAALLVELEAGADGRLVAPDPAAWTSTLGRPVAVDAAWLADRVFSGDRASLRDRFELALFAMRWTRDGGEPPAAPALALFVDAPALALTLERIGVRDNALAKRLVTLLARDAIREDVVALRLVQAAIALVERTTLSGTFDAKAAQALLAGLLDRVEAAEVGPAVATWLTEALGPACARLGGDFDARLVTALAGPGEGGAAVDWEGQRYVVSPGAAARARIERVREAQGQPSLAEAAGVRPHDALADALVALVYASALPAGDPELLASRAELRHDFGALRGPGAQEGRAWRLAEPVSATGVPWHLAGSLLGLDVALAVPSLRRTSDDPPAPTLPAADRVAFARTVALLPASGPSDASRDAVVRLIDLGRRRLAAIATPDDARALAVAAGLSAWRREALAWMVGHDAPALPTALSLTELAWAADPQGTDRAALDAWGTARVAATGELATRAPRRRPWEEAVAHDARAGLATAVGDLDLRVATFLAARALPAALARDLLSTATLELVDRVVAPRADDWRAVVAAIRGMSDTRLEDDVAALTADGPLRPVRERESGQ
jgi:hypothetical protein